MVFLCVVGLIALLVCVVWINFSVLGVRGKIVNGFVSIFDFLLPDLDGSAKSMKSKMANAAVYILAVVIFIFLTSVFFSFALPYALAEEENKYLGPLGDLFNGVLTPVLTFLTFCGLLITIMIQNLQMKSTLEELRLTREEAIESKKVLKEQVENSRAQKFDNNFYSLLDNHNKTISDILSTNSYKEILAFDTNGRKVDQYFFDIFLAGYSFDSDNWIKHKDYFLPFFLVNFQLLSYIDRANGDSIKQEEAKQYSNVFRSLIPNNLLCLLFVNVTAERFGEYRNLIEKYEFFEHMNLNDINLSIFLTLSKNIKISAFGDLRRFKNYFEMNMGNYALSDHWSDGFCRSLGLDYKSKMYLYYSEKVYSLFSEYRDILMSINVFYFAENQFVFDKFTSGDVFYFLESKNISCDKLKNLRNEILQSHATSD